MKFFGKIVHSFRKVLSKHAIKSAKKHMKNERFDLAERVLARSLNLNPKDPKLLNAHATVVVAQKRALRVNSDLEHIRRSEKLDIPAVCQCFWDAESALSLTTLEIEGINIWPVIRMRHFYRVAQMLNLYDSPHPTKQKLPSSENTNPETRLAIKRSQTAASPIAKTDETGRRDAAFDKTIAVIVGTRKVKGEDIYTRALREEAGDKALVLDSGEGASLADGAIGFDEICDAFRNEQRKREFITDVATMEVLENLREFVHRRTGVDIGNLYEPTARDLQTFRTVFQGFVGFWKAHPVETVFVTNGYNTKIRAAYAAAQHLGIKVVELQHGFISAYHMAYSWPNQDSVPYLPDELWCFGPYWPEVTPLPSNTKHRSIGAPYIKQMAGSSQVSRIKDRVTVTSQGVVGRQLFDLAIKLAKQHQEKEVIFRLHPSEDLAGYERELQSYESAPTNFSISHRTPVIFELLATTDVLVGAFSTTLLEGMVLGCRTVVVDLPGIEYMLPIIERGDVLRVNGIDELVEKIDDAPHAKDPTYYYATPVSPLLG